MSGVTVPQYGVEGKHAVLYCRYQSWSKLTIFMFSKVEVLQSILWIFFWMADGQVISKSNSSYRSVQQVYSVRWYKVKYFKSYWPPAKRLACQVKLSQGDFTEWKGVLQLQTRKTQPYHCPQPSRHQCWCKSYI